MYNDFQNDGEKTVSVTMPISLTLKNVVVLFQSDKCCTITLLSEVIKCWN